MQVGLVRRPQSEETVCHHCHGAQDKQPTDPGASLPLLWNLLSHAAVLVGNVVTSFVLGLVV